jgi:hypothetical protein
MHSYINIFFLQYVSPYIHTYIHAYSAYKLEIKSVSKTLRFAYPGKKSSEKGTSRESVASVPEYLFIHTIKHENFEALYVHTYIDLILLYAIMYCTYIHKILK